MKIKKEVYERVVNGQKHFFYPEEKKIAIVKEIEKGELSLNEAKKLYGINRIKTIQEWLRKCSLSSEI